MFDLTPSTVHSPQCRQAGEALRDILVIEDERDIAELIALHLRDLPSCVTLASDGPGGLRLALQQPWDAIVLDIRLPGLNGLDLCREVRAQSTRVPILMLTARDSELDRVLGLELGADDYLTKPFSVLELQARIKALLRRAGSGSADSTLRFGRLEIDRDARLVRIDGQARPLTSHQFELLVALAERAGRVLTREQLMDLVRGEALEAFDRSIDVHIARIRAASDVDPRHPTRIVTVRGAGYVFARSQDVA